MGINVLHAFNSPAADGPSASKVQASKWNAAHSVQLSGILAQVDALNADWAALFGGSPNHLKSLADIAIGADTGIYGVVNFSGVNALATYTLTAFGRSLGGVANAAAGLALLGAAALASPAFTGTPTAPTAAPGTNTTQISTTAFVQTAIATKQPLHSNLTEFSALSAVLNGLPYFTGVGDVMALATLSGFARDLIDDTDAATARATLGAAPLAVDAAFSSGTAATSTSTGAVTTTGSGGVGVGGNIYFGGVLAAPAGAVATPSITASGDLNTGIWFPAADTMALSTAGVEALRVLSDQVVVKGHTASVSVGAIAAQVQIHGTAGSTSYSVTRYVAGSGAGLFVFGKSRSAAVGTLGIVQNADVLGTLRWAGDDGADLSSVGAEIRALVDGVPGVGDMPGRLEFRTTSDGTAAATTRLTINSSGLAIFTGNAELSTVTASFAVGGAAGVSVGSWVRGQATGATTHTGFYNNREIQADVTVLYYGYRTDLSTVDLSVFTLANLRHYSADQGTIGSGSAITNQYGFIAGSTLIGATNNYGFYGNIASGTGRYNLYMNGTAANYLAGALEVGGQITAATGAVGAPSYSFTGDPDTGMWRPAANTLAFSTAGGEAFRILSTQIMIRGHTAAINTGAANATIQTHFNTANHAFSAVRWTANNAPSNIYLGKSRSATIGTFSIVQAEDQVGALRFVADDGVDLDSEVAEIRAVVDGTPGSNDMPGRLEFYTTADGAASAMKRLTIDSAGLSTFTGGVVSTSPIAGIGYTTGAGGTVTQLTSKSTGVTLDKVSGTITMHNAALAADAIVSFVLTDSAIGASDTLSLNHVSGGTPGSYALNARCAAGSATIDVRNLTAGSLSEAIVIKFNLIKGANS